MGYGLVDSPVGQAAGIFEKFHEWTDCKGDPFSVLSADEMFDTIMLYWLTGAGASSARLYWVSCGNAVERGGHFAAFEQPGVFVEEVRAGFRGHAGRKKGRRG